MAKAKRKIYQWLFEEAKAIIERNSRRNRSWRKVSESVKAEAMKNTKKMAKRSVEIYVKLKIVA